jgi:integrase/recombinase XerD
MRSALLVAAGLAGGRGHALISLLALKRTAGLRGHRRRHRGPGLERDHHTLTIVRKGGKVVTVALAPRTARAIDLAVGQRCALCAGCAQVHVGDDPLGARLFGPS